jgi:hypothetical protein
VATSRRAPLSWVLWHPRQKLWNWRLEAALRRVGRPLGIGGALVRALVAIDSMLLWCRVVLARMRELGATEALRLAPPTTRPVLYVDAGVHKRGGELRAVHEWLGERCELHLVGFEASSEHWRDASAALADLPRLDLRQLALVGPDAARGHVRLYKGARDGRADSLFTPSERYEDVPAERLSAYLAREHGALCAHAPLLVRMNIEGSEYDVVDDLVRSGLAARVDGWFGMWDDVAKLDPVKGRRFGRLLAGARIAPVTFNDRDLGHPRRRAAIRLALDAAVRRGLDAKPERPR